MEGFEMVKKAYNDMMYSYGLILMDLKMPKMNGYECSYYIRNFYKKNNVFQPMIVLITAHNEDSYIQEAWRYQIDEVVHKPLNLDQLKEILKDVIDM